MYAIGIKEGGNVVVVSEKYGFAIQLFGLAKK